jgi:hypothetical protein
MANMMLRRFGRGGMMTTTNGGGPTPLMHELKRQLHRLKACHSQAQGNALRVNAQQPQAPTGRNPKPRGKNQKIKKYGVKANDALHISCAIEAGCDYFITTDDGILKKCKTDEIKMSSPIEFITIWEVLP